MRKPRSDSVIEGLPAAQREQVSTWLSAENRSYTETVKLIGAEFGVRTSVGALQAWFSQVERPRQYAQAKGQADNFASLIEGNFDEATVKLVKQLAFEELSRPDRSVSTAKALLKIVGDSAKVQIARQKVELDARKVAILERKAAQAEQAEEITKNGELTADEKNARMREIFGIR